MLKSSGGLTAALDTATLSGHGKTVGSVPETCFARWTWLTQILSALTLN